MALTDTLLQEFLNGERTLDLGAIFPLPVGDWTVLGFDEALLEDMLKDVFEITELVILEFQLDELSGGRLVDAGGLVVGEPQFSASHVVG